MDVRPLGSSPRVWDQRRSKRRFQLAAFAVSIISWATTANAADNNVPLQRPRAMQVRPAPAEPEGPQPEPAADPSPPPASPAATTAPPRTPAGQIDAPPRPRATPSSVRSSDVAIRKETGKKTEKIEHKGVTFDARIGTQGCRRTLCSKSRHSASPGVRLDGFVGGNIRGWVDLGVAGGWGTLGSKVTPGTNALALYGVNPNELAAAAALLGSPLPFPVGNLRVTDAKLRTARVGPLFRLHFVPRGRMIAYVGTGVGYSLFRAKYNTFGGKVRIDLHGIDVPIQGGIGVHVTEHVAVGAQFDYFWTRYGIAKLVHPDQELVFPVRLLDQAAQTQGVKIAETLPHIWSVGFGVRVKI